LVVDEAHLLIDPANKDGIEFLKRVVKRIRKYNGSLWISSQNLLDFTGEGVERYGQVIIDNSAYIIVMGQGLKEIEAVAKMINLSDSEIQFLTTASRGRGLLVISQDTQIPIEVLLREEEKELFGKAGGR
jgi:type IV secretory pathway VirB4 component